MAAPSLSKSPLQGGLPVGPLLTLLSATCFALNTPIAAIAYQTGGNAATLVAFRAGAAALVCAALIRLGARVWRLPPGTTLSISAGTLMLAFQGVCYLGSVAYIPVGLAALIFFTWPMMVAALDPLFGGPRPTPLQWVAFAMAFAGLGLALGPSLDVLDWRGIALALAGGVCLAAYLLVTYRTLRRVPFPVVGFYTNAGTSLIALALLPLFGGFGIPDQAAGWTVVAVLCLIYASGLLSQLAALIRTRSQTVAILFNLEPVISIVAGAILLDELLTSNQYLGGAVVVAALILYARIRPAPPAPAG